MYVAPLVAEQQEVTVAQPAQQRRDILAVRGRVVALRVGFDFRGQPAQGGDQRGRVAGDLLHVGQDLGQQPFYFGEALAVDRRQQLHVYPRFAHVLRSAGRFRFDADQVAVRFAVHLEHRRHDRRVGHTQPVQQHRHGIHQHAAVVGDDLQRGPEPGRIVRGVDSDPALTGGTVLTQPIVGAQHGGSHDGGWDGQVDRTGFHHPGFVAVRAAIGLDVGLRDPVRNVLLLGERGPRLEGLLGSGIDRHADGSQLLPNATVLNRPLAPSGKVPPAAFSAASSGFTHLPHSPPQAGVPRRGPFPGRIVMGRRS